MRDRNAPFVIYRRGPGSFYIVPQGVAGWVQSSAWLALLGLLVMWFTHDAGPGVSGSGRSETVALFVVGLAIWGVGFVWWMLAHAQVIEVAELMRDRQREARRRPPGSAD